MSKMPLATAVVKVLQAEETTTVFGICGGYLFWLLRAFDQAGVRTVPSRNEGAAAFMAAAYAQASGKIGVVFGQGPGALNTLTGAACSYYDSTPMLVIASQAPQDTYAGDSHQEATGSNFGIDQLATFKTVTRASFRCPSVASGVRTLRRALAIAYGQRGPTMIEYPANLFAGEVDLEDLQPTQYRVVPRAVDVEGVAEAVKLLSSAKRPAIVIGNRATHRGLSAELEALCSENGIPFVVADFAKGIIPEDHPLCAGVVGWCGHESAHQLLEASDVVVTIGMRLDSKSTVNYNRELFKNLVQIDEEVGELGRNFPIRVGIAGDIGATVRALRAALAASPLGRAGQGWVSELRTQHATYAEAQAVPGPDTLGSAAAMTVLRQALPAPASSRGASGWNRHYFEGFAPWEAPDGFFCFYGWAAMGSGLPVSMGVQIARPNDVVVSVIGDGGLLVYAGELQIMAEYNLPVIVVVINNAGYEQVGAYMGKFMGSTYGCAIQEIDAAAIAKSFGCDGYTARTAAQLAESVAMALERRRPAIIDVKVTGDKLEDVMLASVEKFVGKLYVHKQPTSTP